MLQIIKQYFPRYSDRLQPESFINFGSSLPKCESVQRNIPEFRFFKEHACAPLYFCRFLFFQKFTIFSFSPKSAKKTIKERKCKNFSRADGQLSRRVGEKCKYQDQKSIKNIIGALEISGGSNISNAIKIDSFDDQESHQFNLLHACRQNIYL